MSLFNGKVALVTGAGSARGIGRGVALALARQGASLVVTDIAEDDLQKVVTELQTVTQALGVVADIRQPAQMETVVTKAISQFGRLDIVVNNAGIARPTPFLDITQEEYELVMAINLKGTFFTCQAAAREMLKRGGGVIINIASVAGQQGGGFFGSSHYSTSKAGVIGLTKALARELTPGGIRVNCIAPGMIDTGILDEMNPERKAELAQASLVRRVGNVEDVARAVLFLAAEENSYITGATLDLNGGVYLR